MTRLAPTLPALLLTGCVAMMQPRTLSPVELDQHGTRVYSANLETGVKAAAIALRTLGYEITSADLASGTIKTAPRDIMSTAAATSTTYVQYRNELAWVLVVSPQGNAIQVKAMPHAYSNGNEVPPTQVPADAIEPKFSTLWNELDQDIKQASTSTTPS
jgi:hypothetical protein